MASYVLGGDGLGPSDAGALSFDVEIFRSYLEALLLPGEVPIAAPRMQRGYVAPVDEMNRAETDTTVMSATGQELKDSLFEGPGFEEKSVRFATDPACQVIYITRERYLDLDEDGELAFISSFPVLAHKCLDSRIYRIAYRLHLPPTPPHSSSIISTLALIKSSPTLDSLLPLGAQLHFVLLSSSAAPLLVVEDGADSGASTGVVTPSAQGTPYDGLHSLVHWGVAPWFDSYVSSRQGLNEGPMMTKKSGEASSGERDVVTLTNS